MRVLTPQSVAAVSIRLRDFVRSPLFKAYPVEVVEAASEDFLGLPLDAIERVTVMAEPPMGANLRYALSIEANQPISFSRFRTELTGHTVASELNGKTLLESRDIRLPSMLLLEPNRVLAAPLPLLRSIVENQEAVATPLSKPMSIRGGLANHVQAAVLLKPLRPFIQLGLAQASPEVASQTQAVMDVIDGFSGIVCNVDLGEERDSSVLAFATSVEAADEIESRLAQWFDQFKTAAYSSQDFQDLLNHEEAVARAWARYAQRASDESFERLVPRRQGSKTFVIARAPAGEAEQYLVSVGTNAVLVALLLPAIQAARDAARETERRNQQLQR